MTVGGSPQKEFFWQLWASLEDKHYIWKQTKKCIAPIVFSSEPRSPIRIYDQSYSHLAFVLIRMTFITFLQNTKMQHQVFSLYAISGQKEKKWNITTATVVILINQNTIGVHALPIVVAGGKNSVMILETVSSLWSAPHQLFFALLYRSFLKGN